MHQSAGELLEDSKSDEDALLTLIRCEGGLYTTNRAIVQGKFHKSYPADQASTQVKLGLGLVEERGRQHKQQNNRKKANQQRNQRENKQPISTKDRKRANETNPSIHLFSECVFLLFRQ